MLKKEDVLHIARLARLSLTDKQVEKFSIQLSGILDLFKKVDDLDLSGVEETSQVTGLKNIFRADEVKNYQSLTRVDSKKLISGAPLHDGTQIIVPKVIEENNG